MDDKLNVFQAVARRMAWLGRRQSVLAQNIANADTPGYRPLDMKEGPFARMMVGKLAPVRPAATHAAHIVGAAAGPGAGAGAGAKSFESVAQSGSYEVKPSGNAVVLEEQLVKMSQTQMDYQTMSNLYRKHLRMFQIAIGGGNG